MLLRSTVSGEYIQETVRRMQLFFEEGFNRVEDCLGGAGVAVNTLASKCGNRNDERMRTKLIQNKGGFKRLDNVIEKLKMEHLPKEVQL